MAIAKEQAEIQRRIYEEEIAPDRLQFFRNEFEDARKTYNNQYALRWVNAGVGMAALSGSVYMVIRNMKSLKHTEKPVYHQEDPLAKLEFNLGVGPQGSYVSGFTLKF